MIDFLGEKINSIGSSIVTMCSARNLFISSIIAASGGGVDIDKIRNAPPAKTRPVHVSCRLASALSRRPEGVFEVALAGEIQLPLVRVSPDGKCWDDDVNFCNRNSIRFYKIQLPKTMHLTIDTSTEELDESVNNLIAELRRHGYLSPSNSK